MRLVLTLPGGHSLIPLLIPYANTEEGGGARLYIAKRPRKLPPEIWEKCIEFINEELKKRGININYPKIHGLFIDLYITKEDLWRTQNQS